MAGGGRASPGDGPSVPVADWFAPAGADAANATLAAASGASLPTLMARRGHASAAAAIRYQHRIEGQDEAVSAFLEPIGRSATAAPDAELRRSS
jgi:hypothetical protein